MERKFLQDRIESEIIYNLEAIADDKGMFRYRLHELLLKYAIEHIDEVLKNDLRD